MTMIQEDEMAWNEHNWQLDAQIKKITMPSWQEYRMDTHNMTKKNDMACNTIGD